MFLEGEGEGEGEQTKQVARGEGRAGLYLGCTWAVPGLYQDCTRISRSPSLRQAARSLTKAAPAALGPCEGRPPTHEPRVAAAYLPG